MARGFLDPNPLLFKTAELTNKQKGSTGRQTWEMEKDWWFWWKSRIPNKILWAVEAESYETKEDPNYTKNCFKEYRFLSGR